MRYVIVENGKIIDGPKILPVSWNNISNFNVLNQETLKLYGWYPYRVVSTDLYDGEVLVDSIISFEENEVIEYQQKRKKTDGEIAVEKVNLWQRIISRREIELKETDWTQLPDVPFSEERRQKWAEYRQALRDITQYTDPDHVIWPTKPE